MVNRTEELDNFETKQARSAFAHLTYEEALRRFTEMWDYARIINPEIGTEARDWREDIEPDIRLAAALNGLEALRKR